MRTNDLQVSIVSHRAVWAGRVKSHLDALMPEAVCDIITQLKVLETHETGPGSTVILIGPDVSAESEFVSELSKLPNSDRFLYLLIGAIPPGIRSQHKQFGLLHSSPEDAGGIAQHVFHAVEKLRDSSLKPSTIFGDRRSPKTAGTVAPLGRPDRRAEHSSADRPRRAPTAANVIAIGASTGGVDALRLVLAELKSGTMPPIVIVQHTRNSEGSSLVQLLDRGCALTVKTAENNDVLRPGCVYLACGEAHLHLVKRGPQTLARQVKGPPIGGHLPAIDATFHSLNAWGATSVGVLLTGMGRDGAEGLKSMHDNGSWAITQSAKSCLVYGMPRAAAELGASDAQMAPSEIGTFLSKLNYAA